MFAVQNLAALAAVKSPRTALRILTRRLMALAAVHHSRKRLAQLDPHMLADIGLTHSAAKTEAGRLIWDAANTWRARP